MAQWARRRANLHRARACVNACAGLPDLNGTISLVADMKAAILSRDPKMLDLVQARLREVPASS
jgi:hypothetical protein